jgi:hypothetical protein
MRTGTLLTLLTVLLAGCGSSESGPKRFHVTGQVNFDGKPVPMGTIYFETTTGPAGSAQITNGQFDTHTGKGVIGGKHQVLIQGYDGKAANPGEMGQPIFNPYRIEADLPQGDSTQTFEVPASAAKGLVITKDPA